MVARPHHATLAKAAKLGFEIAGEAGDNVYTVTNKELEIILTGMMLPELIEDAKLARMIAIEHGLKVEQSVDGWTIKKGRKTLGQGATLDEAWDKASDAMAPKVKAKEGKPAKRRHLDEERDEEADDDDLDDSDEAEEDDEEEEAEEGAGKSIVKKKYRDAYKPHQSTCGDDFQLKMREVLMVKDDHDGKERIDLEKLRELAELNGVWNPAYSRLNAGQQRMNVGNRLRAMQKKGTEIKWPGAAAKPARKRR